MVYTKYKNLIFKWLHNIFWSVIMDIIEKRIKDTKVAYAQFKGSYNQIPDHMQEVGEWVMDEGLKMTGMVYGLYFNILKKFQKTNLNMKLDFHMMEI